MSVTAAAERFGRCADASELGRWDSRFTRQGRSWVPLGHVLIPRCSHCRDGERKLARAAQIVERKLAAIFAADVEGYSRLMGQDESGTVSRLKALRALMHRLIAAHRGRIFNTAGDSVLADFASAANAVQCALAVQAAIAKENAQRGEQMRMCFRIGVHVGDVLVDGTDLLGDAVNIAARLQALAAPGGICVSGTVHDHIGTKVPVVWVDSGLQKLKNIAQPVRVYRICNSHAAE
jgi:adenylate cyclase